AQVILDLAKLMVFLGDGHTSVWDTGENPFFAEAVPLEYYWFEEGLYVIAADPKLKDLLGAQVLAFDGKPATDVLEATGPYINSDRDNPRKTKVRGPYMVRNLKLLEALGLIKRADKVTLTVRDPAGATRDVTVASDATEPNIWNKLPNPP